jgi:hypothetical protein
MTRLTVEIIANTLIDVGKVARLGEAVRAMSAAVVSQAPPGETLRCPTIRPDRRARFSD